VNGNSDNNVEAPVMKALNLFLDLFGIRHPQSVIGCRLGHQIVACRFKSSLRPDPPIEFMYGSA